jgi:ribonuclease P protein component
MLKKKYRLPAGAILTRPTFYNSQSIKLKVAGNNEAVSRFGFIVSKKIDKRSVARNRAKRVVRSCVEELLSKIDDKYDMLFIVQKNAVARKRHEICNEIEALLKQNNLIKKDLHK